MLFLFKGDWLLLLLNLWMFFDDGGESDDSLLNVLVSEDLEVLFDGDELFFECFGLLGCGELCQCIIFNVSVLVMGYQCFILSFVGVCFEKGEQGWSSYLVLNEVECQLLLDFVLVWQVMLMGVSVCVVLLVIFGLYGVMLECLGVEQKMVQVFFEYFSGVVGFCWYVSLWLYLLLLVGQLSVLVSVEFDDELGKLFGCVIGVKEVKVEGGSFLVEDWVDGQICCWICQVSLNFGVYLVSQVDNLDSISGCVFFCIGMVCYGQILLFFFDDQLFGKVLDIFDKCYLLFVEVLLKDVLVLVYLVLQLFFELL